MMGFPQRGEGNLTRATSLCKNFQPNMFNKTKCQNCFRTREAHDLDGGDGSNKPKKVLLCGYLFIAPGLDPENPMSRSRKWQRRCFILYENGELAYALDDGINTVPQGVINMYQCSTVFNADEQTGQKFSLGIQTPAATTFIRAETREEKDSWLETLAEYPEINKENERLKLRQQKLAAQHAAREEKYGKANAKTDATPSFKSETTPKNNLTESWPKSSSDQRDILKTQVDQPKSVNSNDLYKRSQSALETKSRFSDPVSSSISRSTSVQAEVDATAKRKNEVLSSLSSKSIRADEETRSARPARLQQEADSLPDSQSSRATRMRSRIRASDTGISELSKSGAALALGIQRSRSDVVVDRSAYTPLHQNNNNVNSDPPGVGSRGDPQRRSWRHHATQEEPLPAMQELPSPLEKSPKEVLPPTAETRPPEATSEDSGALGRERSSTNESQASAVSATSHSSDDLERLDNPKASSFRVNQDMLDGGSPSPSKRTIERRKHANNRRSRHTVTIDSSMHVIPSSDESEPNKETPTLKRSNSDPNLADSDDMLKRKQIAMTFPGLFHLKKGWLIKQGDGEQDWTKHWFVLCDNKLSYYKDSRDEDPNSLDGVIDLAKCNEASDTPVTRNHGFQIELDTGVIILAAMTSGIRNNWVGAINKAIKTAQEDSAKKSGEPSPSLKESQPLITRKKPNSLPISKSTSDVRPKEERPSPLQPARKSLNNADLMPISSRSVAQTESKATQSPVEPKQPQERKSSGQPQPTRTSPTESLPPSGKPEGRRSSVSKVSSSEARPRKSSVSSKDSTPSEGRRNSVTKEPAINAETKQKHSSPSKDGSGSDSTKSGKSKERRPRRGSRSERSQEESAAAVTAALSKRAANSESKQSTAVRKPRSNSQPEEIGVSPTSELPLSRPRTASETDGGKPPASVDTTVMSLLEQEVDTLKAQLEQKQEDCSHLQRENVDLKARLSSEQRDHKESYQDLENERSGYLTQIEQMADRSRQSELTNQKLQADLRQSKSTVQQLQQENRQLNSQLGTFKSETQRRDQDLASLKARFEDVVQELTSSEREIASTRSYLKAERERSESLETELTDTWLKLRQSGHEGVDVDIVERLSTKLDEARIRLEESESDSTDKEEKLRRQLGLLQSQYQSENAALQDKLKAALQESQELRHRLTERSQKVEKTEAVTQHTGFTDQKSPEASSKITELETSLKELRSQLKAEVAAKSAVQKKYDDLVAQSAHQFLEGQGDMASTGSDDNAIRLEKELDVAGREIEKLRKNSMAEREQKTLLEKAFQREQALRKQLEDKIVHSTQESGNSEVDIEQINSDLMSTRAELKKAKKEREAVNLVRKQLVAAVDSLNSQLSEKDKRLEKLSAELETRGSQNTKLEEQLQASHSETASLRSRLESIEAEMKQLSQKADSEASAQLEALRAEQRQLKREMGSLQEQHALEMHNRQSELETAGDRINSLQEKVAELEIKLKAAMEATTKMENEAAACVLEMQKEEELLRSKCERAEKEVKRVRGELHTAQDNYDELELQFITKREDLKRFEQEHKEQIEQMGYRIQDLTSKLASTERKVRDLRGVDHRNRAKGGMGAAGGMGMQLTQTRQMENKLKELESKLGDVESTLQDQDQDTSSLLGKIVSVEQQVQARGQLPSTTSTSSFDVEHSQQPFLSSPLSRGSSAASVPCDSVSTSGADLSEDSEPAPVAASPDKAKQTFRARFLETKLSETELKLKEVTRKLVDVTTRELENRKAYQEKSVSESRLKERLKVLEREVAAVTKELQQVQSNSRTFACAMRASLTDCGQLLGDIKSGIGWVDLEIGLDGAGRDGLPNQQQRVEVATNPTTTSHTNMLSCLKTLLTDACHKVDQCKQTALSQQTYIEKQSRESRSSFLVREQSGEGISTGSSFVSTAASSSESAELYSPESGSVKVSRQRNPSVIETLQRFANRLSSEVILLGESAFVLHQSDRQKLAKVQMCLSESDSLTAAMSELEMALSPEQGDLNQPCLTHTSQTVSDLMSPRHLLQAETCYHQAPAKDHQEVSKAEFPKPLIDRHSKSRSPLKKQKRTNTSSNPVTHSKSVWTPKLDNFANSLANTVIKAGQLEYLAKVQKGVNVAPHFDANELFPKLHSSELKLEEVNVSLQHKHKRFSEMFEEHLKKVIVKLAEVLALENIRRMKLDKERNRKAGLCVDDDDVFDSFNDIVSLAAKTVDIINIIDSVGPDLVSYAKQITLREARGTAVNLVEDKMLLIEVFHLLQVRLTDFQKKVSLEQSTSQNVLKAMSSVGKKRYCHIESFLEEELVRVKHELLHSYQRAVAEVREGKGLSCGDGDDLHVMLGNYVGLLGSLMIRKVVVGGLARHIVEQMPHLYNLENSASNDLDASLDITTSSLDHVEQEQGVSRIPEPVSAEYENMALHLADVAMERAESAHLSSQLQDEWEQIMQKGRYSPIEDVTAEHARNMAEVCRKYENQLREEELRHEEELNSLQEKYREAITRVDELAARLEMYQVRRASKPQITLTLAEDLNDTLDDLVATRLGEILEELEHTREKLAKTEGEMVVSRKEHVKEVDAITDVMENMEWQYQAEIQTLKAAHGEVVSKLHEEFQDRLEHLKRQHSREMAQWRHRHSSESLHRGMSAAASPDKMGQARNNGDLVLQEKSHREVVEEMRRSHNQEIKALEEEKEKELEDERKATALTITLIQKNHSEELEKEREMLRQITPKVRGKAKDGGAPPSLKKEKNARPVSRGSKRGTAITALQKSHKQEMEQQLADVQQNVSNDVEVVMKRHREVITKMDRDWKIISDKFTQVCAENTSLKKLVESTQKALADTRQELESWQAAVRQLIGRKTEDMAALKEQALAGGNGDRKAGEWGVDGNDNEKNPLQVVLRFREAELQCTNNEINQLRAALEEAEQKWTKAAEQNVFLESQNHSQEEHVKQLMQALEELQHQVDIVRTSGEGQAAQDPVLETASESGKNQAKPPPLGSGEAKADTRLRSWIPFLKRERSDSAGKGSRRRTGSDGTQSATKLKKGATSE